MERPPWRAAATTTTSSSKQPKRGGSASRSPSPAPKVVAVLAGLLERAAERGDSDAEGEGEREAAGLFRGERKPEIGVRRYAERIYRYAGCSPACFVVAYAYLDRLAAAEDEEAALRVDSYSVHRLLITSVLVAAKFMDDIHYNNAYFARVGGVELREMNGLELEFLFALRFRLNVTPDDFASYCAALESHIAPSASAGRRRPLIASPDDAEEEQEGPGSAAAAAAVPTTSFAAARQRAVGLMIAQ